MLKRNKNFISQKKYKFHINNKKISKKKIKNDNIKRNRSNNYKLFNDKAKTSEIKKGKEILYIILNVIGLLLFLVSYYFYFLSLEKCLKGEEVCCTNGDWIKLKIKQFSISAIIIIILVILIINKILSKLHLIHFISTFIWFYKYSHSVFFYDHGGLNLIGLLAAILIALFLMTILKVIIIIFKIKFKYKIFLILFLLFVYNIEVDPTNCYDWAKGLNNTYIQNNRTKYGCKIIFPKKCVYKIIEYTQDISKLTFKSCSNKKKNARKNILKFSKSPYIDSTTVKFGFPLTNNDEGRKDGIYDTILKKYTKHNLLYMDKSIPPELSKPEYIVDFSKDASGELMINLNYNESLSKERNHLEKNSIPYSKNIIIIYVDSISRATSIRKMKKTLSFFDQFISYKGGHNEKYPNENFHSFQFFKYHAHEGYTLGNFPKIFYGNRIGAKDYIRISKYLKENGYITCYSTDACQKDNSITKHNLSKEELYDHQLLLCDPNTDILNSVTKRCLYGNLNAYYLIDYINQFWRNYQNNRKFALFVSNDAHEGTLELIKYTDEIIYNFLISLYNDNLLKDTSIFLVSDHGCTNPSIYFLYEFYQIEIRLPMLYIIVNDRKDTEYNQQFFNIHENQQTFITAYDIYNTISNIIYGDNYINITNKQDTHDTPKSPRGKSLFEEINPKERRPKNYPYMSKKICV